MCLFSIDNVRDENTGSPDRVDALVWGLSQLFDKITARRRSNISLTSGTNTGLNGSSNNFDVNRFYDNNPNAWMT